MNVPDELKTVLSSNPDVMSGAICFVGTRIRVSILLDNLRAGVPVDEFMDAYPDLTRSTIQAVIDWEDAKERRILGIEPGTNFLSSQLPA